MSVAVQANAESPALDLDIVVTSARWSAEPSSEGVVAHAIAAAAAAAGVEPACELCVMLTDDEDVRVLNSRFRGHDKPTNVLSFPARAAPRDAGARRLGDIAIAFETVAREAREQAKPFGHHLAHLAVHGFLHLLGYDHRSEAEAENMEGLERDILARLGVPDPYGPALS